MKGLVSFEGIEGCGKTTQLKLLYQWLLSRGDRALVTREPGGTSLGSIVRRAVLQDSDAGLAREAELFLYLADRAQHVWEVIRPALGSGTIVLSDRFSDSTFAYQGFGRGFDLRLLRKLNDLCTGGLNPDLTILLDCSVEVGLRRAKARLELESVEEDRFERQPLSFHEEVHRGFLALAQEEPDRFVVLDGERGVAELQGDIHEIVLQRLGG